MHAAGMSRQRYPAFLTRLLSKHSDISTTHLMFDCADHFMWNSVHGLHKVLQPDPLKAFCAGIAVGVCGNVLRPI